MFSLKFYPLRVEKDVVKFILGLHSSFIHSCNSLYEFCLLLFFVLFPVGTISGVLSGLRELLLVVYNESVLQTLGAPIVKKKRGGDG